MRYLVMFALCAGCGLRKDINAATPPLGTFWNDVAASGTSSEVLVAPCLNYSVVAASLFALP